MAFYKNEANSVTVLAIDTSSSNAPKTGDALNITCQIVLDSGSPAATTDTNPTEINSSSMPGLYRFDLTAAECNADHIVLKPSSSTGSVEIDPVMIFTTDESLFKADVSSLATSSSLSTLDGKVDVIDGIVDDILVDTNDLQTNQSQWVTATGFSTHSASDVYTQFTTGSNEDVFKADVSSLATSSALSTVSSNVSTIISTGGTGPWTTGSGGSSGASYKYEDTVLNNGNPVDGATVWFTAVDTVTPSLGQDLTNALGEFELYANTEGPFDVHVFKAGDYDSQTYSDVTFTEI